MPNRPHFHHWFRLGYAARGLVFMGLGLLAWTSGRGAASGDVLERIRALRLGSALLGVMVVALRWLGRIGYATRAILFFLIGWSAAGCSCSASTAWLRRGSDECPTKTS